MRWRILSQTSSVAIKLVADTPLSPGVADVDVSQRRRMTEKLKNVSKSAREDAVSFLSQRLGDADMRLELGKAKCFADVARIVRRASADQAALAPSVAALVADSTALVDLIEKSIARRAPGAARDELQKRWTLVKALQKSSRRVAIKRHGGAKSSHGAAAKRKLDGDRIHTNRSLAPST